MRVEKFNVNESGNLINILSKKFSNISLSKLKSVLKSKDIKVDGARVKENVFVDVGQEITIYFSDDLFEVNVDVVYQDENIIVVNKPQNLETINPDGVALIDFVKSQIGQEIFAVHRLDRNTTGLVVFAKKLEAKNELDKAFKNRTNDKFYLALVYGLLAKQKDEMVAYLKKDSQKSLVEVIDKPAGGYEKIQTNYVVVDEYENSSLVEVELITGKTHQIRAHFAHIRNFVVGDEKYGDAKINKLLKKNKQCLCSHKIIFHFKDGVLRYLDGKTIELDKSKIEFCKNL